MLRQARKRSGISQAALAARAGTTQSAISRIEAGRVSPTVETLARLLELLGCRLELRCLPEDAGIDRSLLRESLALPPADRIRRGLAFAEIVRRNRLAVDR